MPDRSQRELDFEELSDDTEVELILPRKGADERGLPRVEISDVVDCCLGRRFGGLPSPKGRVVLISLPRKSQPMSVVAST